MQLTRASTKFWEGAELIVWPVCRRSKCSFLTDDRYRWIDKVQNLIHLYKQLAACLKV